MHHRISSFALLLIVCLSLPVAADDWNQWRGPYRDGVARHSPPLIAALPRKGLKPRWLATGKEIPGVKSSGWSSPVVAGGKLYLFTHGKQKRKPGALPPRKFPYLPPEKRVGMSAEEYAEYEKNRRDEDEQRARSYQFSELVYCLDADSGKLLWTNTRDSAYTRFAQSGSPAILQDRLLILGAGRLARCLDAATGKDLWSTPLPGEFRDQYLQSSFAASDGVAVVLCGALFGLDLNSGKLLWQIGEQTASQLHSSPVVWDSPQGPRFIANMPGGRTVCVEPQSGKKLWEAKTEGGHSTPVVVGDRLITFGSSRKRGLRCHKLSLSGAELIWTYRGAADPGSSPVVVGRHVFVQGDRRLACVGLADGKATWTTSLDLARPRYTSLVAADDKIVYSFDGFYYFEANPDKFRLLANGKIDDQGLLADEQVFRQMWNIDELETTAEGQREAEKILRRRFSNGTLPCASSAIVDGKIYLRLKNGLACYDLRKQD